MINSLFDEFDTDVLVVTDFDIQFRGCRVDTVCRDENGIIHIYADHPDNKYAEELQPSPSERKQILEEVMENF